MARRARCSFGRNGSQGAQAQAVRRIVRDFIHTAIIRAQPTLEEYIGQHLLYPEPFPFTLTDTVAVLQELRSVHIAPRWPGDYPPVDVIITAHALLTAKTRRRDEELGPRTFAADVEIRALGAVHGTGYTLVPEEARLTAWWGHSPAGRPTGQPCLEARPT